MKRTLTLALMATLFFVACSGGGKETPKSIAEKWCELNGKVARAADGPEKDAAKAARKEYENEMQKKYEKDSTFMEQVGKEVEKCETASEGK